MHTIPSEYATHPDKRALSECLICAVDQTWQFLFSASQFPPPIPARALAPCQSSVWNHITLVCARSSADVGGDAAVICKKKWHIPFLKATGFFSPFQEFVFFYKWLSAPVTQHDTTENVFDIIKLLAVKQWRFIHPLFWGRISFSSIWRSG